MNANNTIVIHGRLTRDPELKTGSTGSEYCNFTVAVDSYNGKEKETDFFDCTAFGQTGVAISKFMTKGREILVEGRMESNKSEKDGVKRTFWGVTVDTFEFCGGKSDASVTTVHTSPEDAAAGFTGVETDELPF
jgi:single-strand DNA-binding protein